MAKPCRVSFYITWSQYQWHLPAAFCSLLWCTKFFSCSLHIAYRACRGFWVTNSWGAGADCFFDWELTSGRGRVAGWVPAEPKGVGSFLLSWCEIFKKRCYSIDVCRCLKTTESNIQTDCQQTGNPASHSPSNEKCTPPHTFSRPHESHIF